MSRSASIRNTTAHKISRCFKTQGRSRVMGAEDTSDVFPSLTIDSSQGLLNCWPNWHVAKAGPLVRYCYSAAKISKSPIRHHLRAYMGTVGGSQRGFVLTNRAHRKYDFLSSFFCKRQSLHTHHAPDSLDEPFDRDKYSPLTLLIDRSSVALDSSQCPACLTNPSGTRVPVATARAPALGMKPPQSTRASRRGGTVVIVGIRDLRRKIKGKRRNC